jgi:hypothetical protein
MFKLFKKMDEETLCRNQLEHMSFKEFDYWCNIRACDGLWGSFTICLRVLNEINGLPWFMREKFWKVNYEQRIIELVINPTNAKIDAMLSEQEVKDK